ncbi:Rieske 2Fe-2S domain-containing protein [Streptomyces collinus]|uniref:Rieske 2Fe-2S domain-containing protein n=1 Tax=Streptomyces collinus TaxID=42684 RepID=UPI0036C3EE57
MNESSKRSQAEQALRHAWFPVARAADLGSPQAATLLGERLVVYRAGDGTPVVQSQRCPHRGADLSQGRVTPGGIACPYHGWQFSSTDGRCTLIPSLQKMDHIPPRAAVKTYPVVERFEHIWTVLDSPATPMYNPPSWRGRLLHSAAATPMSVPVGVASAMENFRDVAHFPFVHSASMGDMPETVEPLTVTREGRDVHMNRAVALGDGDWSANGDCTMRYRCSAPGFASVIYDYKDLGKRFLGIFPSPHSYDSVTLFCVVAIEQSFRGTPLAECVRFEEMVTTEDIAIVGRLDPPEVPWDKEALEVSVPADAFTLNYRAAFWSFVRDVQRRVMDEGPSVSAGESMMGTS